MNTLMISIENPKLNIYNVKLQDLFNYEYLTEDFKYDLDREDAFKYRNELLNKYANKYKCLSCIFKY